MSFGNLRFRRGWSGIVLAGALATAGMGQGALSSVPAAPWSSAASGLIQRAFEGLDEGAPVVDVHTHIVGLGLSLLTHAGEEKAVGAAGAQALGNPLRLRRPLDAGLTVIVAHCASLGCNEDLDHPGRKASSYELFLRLMAVERYRGRLFGEISAMTQVNRLGTFRKLLQDPVLQDRLLNGSDYPLPAMNLVVWTSQAVRQGLITRRERRALNEIYRVNPLLFDFVLKRTVKDPKRGQRLPGTLFQRGQ
jgi:hypothetical protein